MKRDFSLPLTDLAGDPVRDADAASVNAVAAVRDWMALGMPSDGDARKQLDIALKEAPALTLGRAAVNALVTRYQDEQNIAGEELLKRYRLAKRIHEDTRSKLPTELSTEELDLIKRLLVKLGYGPIVVGAATELLEKDYVGAVAYADAVSVSEVQL